MRHIYHYGYVDDQYLSPTYCNIRDVVTIVGVWMINTYHHNQIKAT